MNKLIIIAALMTMMTMAVPVDMARVKDQIRAMVQTELQGKYPHYELTIMNHPPMSWSDTEYQVRLEPPKSLIGTIVIPATLYSKARQIKTDFQISVKVWDTILTAQQSINRKQMISEAMLSLAEKDITSIILSHKKVYHSTDEVVGYRSKNYFKAGDILASDRLEMQPDILKDQVISLLVNKHDIEVKLPVMAMEEGFIGDVIKVLNTRSKKVLMARIDSKDSVEMVN